MASQPITFPCPFCGRRMGVPAELLGKQVRCPHCKQVVVAPATASVPPVPQAPPPPQPVVVQSPPPAPIPVPVPVPPPAPVPVVVQSPPPPPAPIPIPVPVPVPVPPPAPIPAPVVVQVPPPAPMPIPLPPPATDEDLPTFNIAPKKEGADSILSDPDESEDEVFGSAPGSRNPMPRLDFSEMTTTDEPAKNTLAAQSEATEQQITKPIAPVPVPVPVAPPAPAPVPVAPPVAASPPASANPFFTATVFDLPVDGSPVPLPSPMLEATVPAMPNVTPQIVPPPTPAPAPMPLQLPDLDLGNPFGDLALGPTELDAAPPKPAPIPQPVPVAPKPVPVPTPMPVPVQVPAPVANPFAVAPSNPFGEFDTAPVPVSNSNNEEPEEAPKPAKKRKRDEEPEEAPRPTRGRAATNSGGKGNVVLYVVIGYAVLATALAVYGMFFKSGGSSSDGAHPLSTIPDNFGEFDPVTRKKVSLYKFPVDGALPADLRASLGGKVSVGQIEVQPVRVQKRRLQLELADAKQELRQYSSHDALVLTLSIKNTSPDLSIFPMDPAFTRKPNFAVAGDKPITRLVIGNQVFTGGEIEWPLPAKYKKKIEVQQGNDAIPLRPGESREYVVFTEAKPEIAKAAQAAKESMQWRVQVRRGLIDHKGREIPVTAVIGVDFKASDIRGPE